MIGTVQTKVAGISSTAQQNPRKSLQTTPPAPSAHSLPGMENLDLELNINHLPLSRPIGESSKFRSSSQVVTHLSHAAITELEAGWHQLHAEDSAKGRELLLTAMQVHLKPGENRVKLQGKVSRGLILGVLMMISFPPSQADVSGEFAPHKVSLKYGSLDFVYTVAPERAMEQILRVEDPQVNVDIALTPEEGGMSSSH